MIAPLLIQSLMLKIALTVAIVVGASIAVERSGPFVGGLIAALPTSGGAAMIILALEHSPEFIAASVIGSIVTTPFCAIFALIFAALVRRHGIVRALAVAYSVWFTLVALSQLVPWTLATALALNAVAFPLTIFVSRHYRDTGEAQAKVKVTAGDLAWRAALVTVVVLTVTLLSHWIGSFASGALAFFPVALTSFLIILNARVGRAAAASVAAHIQAPLIGLTLSFAAVHLLAVPLGVWWSFIIGLSVGLLWNALLWTLARMRVRQHLAGTSAR